MKAFGLSIFAVAIFLVSTSYSPADELPADLLSAIFGPGAIPQVGKVVVVRVNPWLARVIDPSPELFELGQATGDSTASMTDDAGILMLEDALRHTGINSEGCFGTTYTAKHLPVSWAIFFFPKQSHEKAKIGALYLTLNGLCASAGTKLYNVDPQAISLYLKRNFSFMNF
jgi:hypothetical protein